MDANTNQDIAKRPMFRFLILLTFTSALAQMGWSSLYTNFAVDIVHVTGEQTGIIHSLREVPGLLSVGVILCLLLVSEHKLVALAVLTTGIGTVATGFFPSFHGIIFTAMLMSFGFHYYEATAQSLTLQYFSKRETPVVMGKLRSATAAGSLFIGLLVFGLAWLMKEHGFSLETGFKILFSVAGFFAIVGGLWALTQKPQSATMPVQRKRMIVRKQYWLFYVLTLLSGARRHIFTTFSIFLLVKIFNFTIQEMLGLFIFNNAVNWFVNPIIGKAINSIGERKLLTFKYFVLALIFVAYCTSDSKIFVGALYAVEQIFTNFSMAIRSFFQKIADPQDIAPSMAVGQTINHISAVILPVVGGMLWMIDYRIPFWIGIAVALLAMIMVQFIRYPKEEETPSD